MSDITTATDIDDLLAEFDTEPFTFTDFNRKLISHRTSVTLPSGTTVTTLHLTPEAKAGLSTNGARIPETTMHNPSIPREDCPRCQRNDRIWSVASAVLGAALLLSIIAQSCR